MKLTVTIGGFVLAGCLCAATKTSGTDTRTKKPPVPQTQAARPEFKQRLDVYVLRGELRPKLIYAVPGKAIVTIENQTFGTPTLSLASRGAAGTDMLASIVLRSQHLEKEVSLTTGDYVIYDASNPSARTHLIVKPPQ
jgi:hypothetical protein